MNLELSTQALPGVMLIAFLAIIHMAFQLGTSVLTLLSGHSLTHRRALHRLGILNLAFIIGVFGTTMLILTLLTSLAVLWIDPSIYTATWLVLFGLAIVVAMLIMVVYYRDGKGTRLWVPRSFASYLTTRAKKTKNGIEALALGVISAIAELPFTGVLLLIAAMTLSTMSSLDSHLLLITIYTLASIMPLVVITILLAGGHRLSTIQRWRESSKTFLQYAAGIGLLVASLFILVFFIIVPERL